MGNTSPKTLEECVELVCRKDAYEEVKSFIEAYPDKINENVVLKFALGKASREFTCTLLIYACYYNRIQVVSFLLSKPKCDLDKKAKLVEEIYVKKFVGSEMSGFYRTVLEKKGIECDHYTAKQIAQFNGYDEIIKLFLEREAAEKHQVNEKNNAVTPILSKNPPPQVNHIASRIMDLTNEPSNILNPIVGLLDKPLSSFDEAIECLKPIIPGTDSLSFACTMFVNNLDKNKKHNLSDDSISAINLYTRESIPRENSLYFVLNKALREQDRKALLPFFPYFHLLLYSMYHLPRCSPGTVIWRGVKNNISMHYTQGKKIIWWGFSSCTKDMKALDIFLGKDESERTLFAVQVDSAIEITNFSAFPNEEEVLIFPCVTFEILNVYSPSKGLWIIQLKEIFPPGKLIDGFASM